MEKNSHTLTSPTLPGRAWQHLRMMLLTALLAAMTGQTARAQEGTRTLTVYDGNTTNAIVPANIFWFNEFTRSQFVIPASELEYMAGGTISSLTFYTTIDNVPYTTTCSVDVYLTEVDYTSMTALEPKASGTIVYQGTLSIVEASDGGTMTITFTTPYTYGGGNLLIGIENTPQEEWRCIYFYGQQVAGAAWAGYDEGSLAAVTGSQQDFIPMTTFTYTPRSGIIYYEPTNLTLTYFDLTTATLSWAAPSTYVTGYAYQYKLTDTEEWSDVVNVPTTTATLSGLTAATTYDFRVKSLYNDGGESRYATLRFNTTAIAPVAVGDSWSDDFEGDACSWQLLNGDLANAWVWGTATHSGGTHALYISNDGGTNNAYNTDSEAIVYAAKPFTFTDGKYEIAYDWRCYGEGNYDYLRVALVPATEMLEASTSMPRGFSASSLPSGWIALDGGGKLNLTQEWQSKSAAISNLAAGSYYLVFAWRNDFYYSIQPPAAVDNVSIRRVSCAADVDNLAVSYTGGTTATLSWAAGEATQWQVAYSTSSDFAQATEAIVNLNPNLNVQNYTLTDLPIGSTCYARVRAYCGGTDYGAWSETVSFEPTDMYVIGTGTQTSTSLPTDTYYNYSRTQQLYTAAELGAAGAEAIMSIAFKNASSEACTRRIDIYMVGTAKSSFEEGDDWVSTTTDDLVFSGEVTFAAGQWTTITLDTPFEYNGQSNVVIAVDDHTGSYIDGNTEFLAFSATGQALYAYSYDIFPSDASGTMSGKKNQLHLGKGELPAVVRPTALAVGYTGGTTATLSWTENGTATEWDICLNDDETNLVSINATQCTIVNGQWSTELTGLSYATIYQVKVRARQDGGVSYWSLPTRFNTELCAPDDLCNIALVLTDSRGDGWKGNAIKVVDKQSGIVIGTYANTAEAGANEPQTCLVAVPNGRDIQFVWVKGTSTAECSFSIYDVNDELICKFDKNDQGPAAGLIATYTVDCSYSPWRTPVALTAVQDIPTTATLSWTERGEATAWVVAYKADGDEDFTEVVVNQNENQNVITYTLTGLAGLTQYTVKVRPDSGEGGVVKWSEPITFTTIDANPVPTNVTATAGTRKATLSWTGYGDNYNVRYRPADHFSSSLFTEGFEGGIDNWILRDCDRMTAISNTKVHAGNQAFMFENKNDQYLISPELTDIANGTLMEFYYSNYYNNEDQNLVTFQVGFSSTTNETDEFDFGPTITTYDAQWHLYSAAVPAGTKYVCWKVLSTRTWMFFIDDIKIGKEVEFTNLSTTATTKTLTGLAPGTTYEYQVQSVKDEAASAWTELATFTTSVVTIPSDLTVVESTSTTATLSWAGNGDSYNVKYSGANGQYVNVVLSQDFENGLNGWTRRNCGQYSNVDTYSKHTGSYGFRFSSIKIYSPQYLISPELPDVTGNAKLEFYYMNNDPNRVETFQIGYSTTTNDTDQFTFGDVITASDMQWHHYSAAIPAGTKYICWKLLSNDKGNLFIDDISVASESKTITATENTITITGLTPGSDYAYQVQSVDDGGTATDWSEIATFSTKHHLPGDADNDGYVTINDVIAVVNYILGNTPDKFDEANADVDSNIGITITDAVTIVNMVLTQQEPEPESE